MDPNQPSNPYQTPPQPIPQDGVQPQAMPGQVAGNPGIQQPPVVQQSQPLPTYPSTPPPPAPVYGVQQPMSPLPTPPGSNRKKLVIIIAAVVAVCLLGGGAFLLTRGGGDSPVSNLTNTIKGGGDIVDRKDGTLDLSDLIDKQASIKTQDLKAKLNQQVNLSDGISYMVTSVERNFTPESRSLKAGTGKELVKVTVVAGNKSKKGSAYISSSLFQIRNSAGGLINTEYVAKSEMPDVLKGESIEPGKQLKGTLVFEVEKDEKLAALVTEKQYKNYSSDKVVTIKSEVAL